MQFQVHSISARWKFLCNAVGAMEKDYRNLPGQSGRDGTGEEWSMSRNR